MKKENTVKRYSRTKLSKKFDVSIKITTAITILTIFTLFASISLLSNNNAFALTNDTQPDINAADVYQNHKMVLGNNIKNLVTTIPNEGHEPPYTSDQVPKELRNAADPYYPEQAVVNAGTTVVWFTGDVGHKHSITLVNDKNPNTPVYSSSTLTDYLTSAPVKLNDAGTYTFTGPSDNKKAPDYVMKGTINVIKQPLSTTPSNIDTVVSFMIPANMHDKLVSDFKSQGLSVDSTYPFKALRGGGGTEACGDKNLEMLTLTSSGKSLDDVISTLAKISPTMPCT